MSEVEELRKEVTRLSSELEKVHRVFLEKNLTLAECYNCGQHLLFHREDNQRLDSALTCWCVGCMKYHTYCNKRECRFAFCATWSRCKLHLDACPSNCFHYTYTVCDVHEYVCETSCPRRKSAHLK